MSSIGQSILMALTVTVNRFASSNVQAVHRRERKTQPAATTTTSDDFGRRSCLLLSTLVAAPQVADSRTDLVKQYLKKSEENKSKNDKEVNNFLAAQIIMLQRLDSYYRRNYKDYFELVEGASKGNQEQLSEAEKGIIEWLQKKKMKGHFTSLLETVEAA